MVFAPGIILLEIENVADIGAAPAVDRLVFVAHHADVIVRLREQAHQLILAAVGVLIFVDHDVAQPAIPGVPRVLIVEEQADAFEQQIVEIERIGLVQRLLVFLVNRRDFRHARIGRFAVHLLRRFLQALGVADLRKRRAIRHRLLVEPHAPVGGLDDGELVFIVVDGKRSGEAGANGRQRVAVAPQQPHAERVERRNLRRPFESVISSSSEATRERISPAALLVNVTARTADGGHVLRADQVRDPMRDDARLAAARAGENQHRAFGGFDRFTLLGIEAREKIHYLAIFALAATPGRESTKLKSVRIALRGCALFLAAATAAGTADPDGAALLNRAREKVLDNTRRLPRYTCIETISRTEFEPPDSPSTCQTLILMRRLVPARGSVVMRDRLRLDVAVADGGEIFSWAGAGKFDTRDVSQLVGRGASGSGEFGTFLSSVFGSAPDPIHYAGVSNGLALFEYNVPIARSLYRFHGVGGDETLGFHGTFSVDPSTGDPRRLEVETEQFAPRDTACRLEHVMNYRRVKIGSGEFLLPELSTMDGLYHSGAESLNETRFSNCREYVGESTVHFDDPDATAAPAASKSALQPLPPGTRLLIGLSKPIDTATAAAGDAVEGVLLSDSRGGLAHTNDRLHGRILRLQQYMYPPARWYIAIRFDTIERNGIEQPISLKPADDGDRSTPRVKAKAPPGAAERPEGAGVFSFAATGNTVLDRDLHSDGKPVERLPHGGNCRFVRNRTRTH